MECDIDSNIDNAIDAPLHMSKVYFESDLLMHNSPLARKCENLYRIFIQQINQDTSGASEMQI